VKHSKCVDVADAIILRQAGLRRSSKAGVDGHAVTECSNAGTATQVAGDVAKILAPQQRRGVLVGGAMAGAVKSVAANTVLLAPLVRHGVGGGRLVHEAIGSGLDHRNQRDSGKLLAKGLNSRYIGRIVRGSEKGVLLHRLEQIIADQL